jgi:hypothetical protein
MQKLCINVTYKLHGYMTCKIQFWNFEPHDFLCYNSNITNFASH